MKLLAVLCALVAFVAARPDDHYSDRYNNFNIDELIGNERLMKSNVLCFEDEGKCTPEMSEIKELAPEAVQTSCAKCTDQQKVLVAKVMKAVMEKLPEDWEKLRKKYDSEGKYENDFKAFVEKYSA
ncbi:allergen Tha p 1-like [Colias croceus]|uniref:allergen Tha p 1-like n=1 Tax=Colias crocea TaxID=72248 RepID=UPI001E280638|nr:allergen Tha p 1-like [Colias croceus]